MNPIYNKWYMDDGRIVGDVELLKWDLLQSRGPELGLHLNPAKYEWSWLDFDCNAPLDGVAEEDQVKLVPHAEIQMLGKQEESTFLSPPFGRSHDKPCRHVQPLCETNAT